MSPTRSEPMSTEPTEAEIAEAREAAERIIEQFDGPEVSGPQFHKYMAVCVTTDDVVKMARALLSLARRGREVLPPGRTKQDVVNLVDLALSDSMVNLGNGDGSRYDYDTFVERLAVNDLAIVSVAYRGRGEDTIERAAKVLHDMGPRQRNGARYSKWENELPEYREWMREKVRAVSAALSSPAPHTGGDGSPSEDAGPV